MWRLLADLTVALHAAYVAFVVLGLAAILLGHVAGWRCVRNLYFRLGHLAAILAVCAEALLGRTCPLTTLENLFRQRAGGAGLPWRLHRAVARLAHLLQRPPVGFYCRLSNFWRERPGDTVACATGATDL
jgi:hypothetical protein